MRSMHRQTKHQSVNPVDSAASLVELWDRLAGTMEVEVQADPRGGKFSMIWTLAHTNDAELVQKVRWIKPDRRAIDWRPDAVLVICLPNGRGRHIATEAASTSEV